MKACENCKEPMRRVYRNLAKREKVQIYKCPRCKLFWAPDLDLDLSFNSKLDEQKRLEVLTDVRESEFDQVLQMMQRHISAGHGLEVGCAYGQFMQKAEQYYKMEGVEAEDAVAEKAREKGLCVHTGLFPQNFTEGKGQYDFIIFNNAWEHINHTEDLLRGCLQYIKWGG